MTPSFRLAALVLVAAACTPLDEGEVQKPPVEKDPEFVAAATQVKTSVAGATGANYFAAPWPDDRRLDSQGFFRSEEFPNPGGAALFSATKTKSAKLVKGWGTNTPVYVPFSAALDASQLPTDPEVFRGKDAPFFLVAIDKGSKEYGKKLPLEWEWFGAATLFLPGNVLAVRPVLGFTLEPKTRYALVLTNRLKDASGAYVGPERPFFEAIRTKAAAGETDRRYLQPVLDYLDEKGFPRAEVAGAIQFTTQDTVGELFKLRDWLEAQPAPVAADLKVLKRADGSTWKPWSAVAFEGTYEAPNFMHGTPVYESAGGEFVYDAEGNPVPNKHENMRFAICLPDTPPVGTRYPVAFVSHGTGGDYLTFVRDGTCGALASKGIASIGIDNVLHGPRAEGADHCLQGEPYECWFNLANPVSSRNLIRQAALDHISLRKMAAGLALATSLTGLNVEITLDLTHYGFFGHSQGGLTGALYTAIDRTLAGSMLSGSGGHITSTLLDRPKVGEGGVGGIDLSPRELAELLLFNIAGKEQLSQMHPAMAFLQLVGEAADPVNYAKYWLRAPDGRRKSVLLMNGVDDPETPKRCPIAYAVRGGIPPFPKGRQEAASFALAELLPISGDAHLNVESDGDLPAVTAGFRHFPGQGHFPVYDDDDAIAMWTEFFRTLVSAGEPTVPNR